jgi:hypothetical protein
MSFMFEWYCKPPPSPQKEAAVTNRIAALGGRLDYRENSEDVSSKSVCLTYEFDDFESAVKAAEELRKQGDYVEGPVDYGP